MSDDAAVKQYLSGFKVELEQRLRGFYDGMQALKAEGFSVNAIAPMAAIYLTVQFELKGKTTADGKVLSSTEEVTSYLLSEAGLAVVPFYAFGSSRTSSWYRLSVGTASLTDVNEAIESLRNALSKLS
jgi:aspartate aminotransferase